MHKNDLEIIVTRFQACVRGYLIREEVRRARVDFEDIVKEIDGSLTHLRWTDVIVSIPYFTDYPGVSSRKTSESGLHVGDTQIPLCSVRGKRRALCPAGRGKKLREMGHISVYPEDLQQRMNRSRRLWETQMRG
ncbi:IQ domain-containing protein C [Oryzias melastigma]|uniref:IQ domain-containing protein C n=1 Tax=Oryzias melastigma TaxID=30732 RepID=A0A834C4J2_ORYME|nr:IQ domain-containing protein C [Oryzias melastigma]